MESPAPPLETLSTAVITLGGDIAWTVDTELAILVAGPGMFPTLIKADWTAREFTFHGAPVQVAANLLSFWSLCRGIDLQLHPHPCDAPCKGASPAPPGGEVRT